MTDESKIVAMPGGGVMFVGPDATRLYQATALRSALGLLAKGIQPTRGFTMKRGLAAATAITGKSRTRARVGRGGWRWKTRGLISRRGATPCRRRCLVSRHVTRDGEQ